MRRVFLTSISFFIRPALVLSVILSTSLWVKNSVALTIEEFHGSGAVVCSTPSNIGSNIGTINIPSAGSLGANLTLRCEKSDLNSGPKVTVTSGTQFFSHSQDFAAEGLSEIEWDGDTNANSTNYSGLNGVDLTQDGGDAIRISKVGFDCANAPGGGASNVVLSVLLHDSRDPGSKASFNYQLPCWTVYEPIVYPQQVKDVSYGYNGGYPVGGVNFTFPFSEFTQFNLSRPLSFASIGAINVTISGITANADLSFTKISTNGTCPNVPDPLTGIACTPTPTVTPTLTPTATPTITPTATPTPIVTVPPSPTPTLPATINECTRVAPTAEMIAIGRSLLSSGNAISKIIKEDIKRASKARQCNGKVNGKTLLQYIRTTEAAIKGEINENILQSVEVCGTDCVKVSFLGEVTTVKNMLKKYGNAAKANAKKVASCAKSVRRPGTSSTSTLNKVSSVVNKPVNVTCTVCP